MKGVKSWIGNFQYLLNIRVATTLTWVIVHFLLNIGLRGLRLKIGPMQCNDRPHESIL